MTADPLHDLVIAGGGPAGLMAAIQARRAGLGAVVLESARPPIDRACGEGVMPDGVELLRECGVDLEAIETHPLNGIRYVDDETVAVGRFDREPGLGIRRSILHDALHRRARVLGADIRWGVRVTGLASDGFETPDGSVRGRWLVAADGRNSRVRRWAGLDGRPTRHRRFGVRRHFAIAPWTDLVEVYWGHGCEAYVTPVGERQVGVAMLWSGETAGFDELITRFPTLADRLSRSEVASRDRGAGPLERRCTRTVKGRLALIGDASGYLDPITGEGLTLAFRHAAAVVDAIRAGDLDRYRAAHRRINRFPIAMIRLLLVVERSPRVRRRVIQALASKDRLMSKFLALKTAPGGSRLWGRGGLARLVVEALRGAVRSTSAG